MVGRIEAVSATFENDHGTTTQQAMFLFGRQGRF